ALVLGLLVALLVALPYLRLITDTGAFTEDARRRPFVELDLGARPDAKGVAGPAWRAWVAHHVKPFLAFAALAPFAWLGLRELVRRRREAPAFLLLLAPLPVAALLLFVHMQQDTEYKFVFAAAPFAALYATLGLARLERHATPRARRIAFAAFALFCLGAP